MSILTGQRERGRATDREREERASKRHVGEGDGDGERVNGGEGRNSSHREAGFYAPFFISRYETAFARGRERQIHRVRARRREDERKEERERPR